MVRIYYSSQETKMGKVAGIKWVFSELTCEEENEVAASNLYTNHTGYLQFIVIFHPFTRFSNYGVINDSPYFFRN